MHLRQGLKSKSQGEWVLRMRECIHILYLRDKYRVVSSGGSSHVICQVLAHVRNFIS